jgi:hypothetical protein
MVETFRQVMSEHNHERVEITVEKVQKAMTRWRKRLNSGAGCAKAG